MKKNFTILFFLFSFTNAFSQVIIQGTIRDSTGNGFVRYAEIRLMHQDTVVYSDDRGWFKMIIPGEVNDTLLVSYPGLGSKKIALKIKADDGWMLDDIRLPGSCKTITHNDLCPKCHSKQDVIRIVYGLPKKEAFDEAEKGNIWLGGCMVDDCSPLHYCKKDKIEF